MYQQVEGAYALRRHVGSSSGQTSPYMTTFGAAHRGLVNEWARVNIGLTVWLKWTFFFSSLFSPWKNTSFISFVFFIQFGSHSFDYYLFCF
jgi:hypothetical protein